MRKSIALMSVVALAASFSVAFATDDKVGKTNDKHETSAATIFDERIMPIFRSPNPSSCVECHLSSVDLKNYILPSHEKTFVSLRDQGLVDLDNPRESKILGLIEMGSKSSDKGARMIHADLRKAEYEAFAGWIEACASDDELRNLPPLEKRELASPDKPDEVIRHARKSRVVDSFVRNIWSQRMRCFPCHTPHEILPRQKPARKKFEDWKSKFGERMLIFKETPEQTLEYLIAQSKNAEPGHVPLLNLKQPAKSLLVIKPISKLPKKENGEFLPPTYSEPVSHMGGLKMHPDDHSYKAFITWITDYANVVADNYTSVEDLPADNWFATKRVLRCKEIPETWPVGTPVQMFVFARNADDSGWTDAAVAFTQGTITRRRIVNGPLFMLAPTDETSFRQWKSKKNRLPPGRYLIKIHVDSGGKLAHDSTLLLGSDEYRGQVEIASAKWRPTFPKAEWISASDLK